jgi:hypothetical protein
LPRCDLTAEQGRELGVDCPELRAVFNELLGGISPAERLQRLSIPPYRSNLSSREERAWIVTG